MRLLDRMERKFGKFAIKNLATYIVLLNAAVFIMKQGGDSVNIEYKLALIPELVLNGEVWRLITYVFLPPNTSLIWIFFVLMFY